MLNNNNVAAAVVVAVTWTLDETIMCESVCVCVFCVCNEYKIFVVEEINNK